MPQVLESLELVLYSILIFIMSFVHLFLEYKFNKLHNALSPLCRNTTQNILPQKSSAERAFTYPIVGD